MNDKILLLIAAYVRKTNHPEETEAELMQNVIADLKKVSAALRVVDRAGIDE